MNPYEHAGLTPIEAPMAHPDQPRDAHAIDDARDHARRSAAALAAIDRSTMSEADRQTIASLHASAIDAAGELEQLARRLGYRP